MSLIINARSVCVCVCVGSKHRNGATTGGDDTHICPTDLIRAIPEHHNTANHSDGDILWGPFSGYQTLASHE